MINALALKNFKCFEDLHLSFGPLTMLTGINGAGKSSVIQALLLLRQTALNYTFKNEGLHLNGDLVSMGAGRDVLHYQAKSDRVMIELHDDADKYSWSFEYDEASEGLMHERFGEPGLFAVSSALFEGAFQYIRADRIGPKTSYPMPAGRRSSLIVADQAKNISEYFLGCQGEYTPHFLAAFGTSEVPIRELLYPDEPSSRLDLQTSAWMHAISPGVQIETSLYSAMDIVNLQYFFRREGEVLSNAFRASNVGFGITYTLPIVVALLAARPGSLLLLENPEAHLHPRVQSHLGRLVALAAANGVQVILETHSDHVLNGVRVAVHEGILHPNAAKIHFFQFVGNATSPVVDSPIIDRNGRLDYWPEGFFDEMDRNLEVLLSPAGGSGAN